MPTFESIGGAEALAGATEISDDGRRVSGQ